MQPSNIQKNLAAMNAIFKLQARVLRWIVPGLLAVRSTASAQEALLNSFPARTAANQTLPQQPTDYTYKNGDFRLWATPALDLQCLDNIEISQANREADFIVRPQLGLVTTYPISQQNLLRLDFTVGYNTYLTHDNLDGLYLQSGSGLSFDLYLKEVLINLHDKISYVQDSSQYSAVANTASYGTFQNTAGLSASWDARRMVLSAGYDHLNVQTTSSQFNDTDRATEMLFARAGYVVYSKLTAGLETSASFTTYDQALLNNNQSYSLGAYADFMPDAYFDFQPRAGYVIYQFDQNSRSLQTSDLNSWYADLKVTHAVTDAISYSIDAGHRVGLGVQSDAMETWYVTPSATWNLTKDWSLHTSMSYENGQQGTGSTLATPGGSLVSENYSWFTGTLGVSHPITSRIAFNFNYRLTTRSSSSQGRGYSQNELELQLTYHPQ
jgi:hypothetical protein